MNKSRKQFQESMYDYNNVAEYYSFYGNVIYVSTNHLSNNPFFIILKRNNSYALVYIDQPTIDYFVGLQNRSNVADDLGKLESTITFVNSMMNFRTRIQHIADSNNLGAVNNNELIKLKNCTPAEWDYVQLTSMVELFRKDHTTSQKPIRHDIVPIADGVTQSITVFENLFDSQFMIQAKTVAGNPFIDITVRRYSMAFNHRMYYYDIKELATVIDSMTTKDESIIMPIVANFANFTY